MALPLNRIKKIKLNDNTTYDIVPESLEKNGHQAALPDLSKDSTIALTSDLPTKQSLGLGNVDNTSDLDKPVSTATQTALDAKQATLVSGTNIKTINNESVLGSGNLEIETTEVALVSSLPVVGTDDTIYLSDANVSSQGGVVELPVPTVSDAGKVFTVGSTGAVALQTPGGIGGHTLTIQVSGSIPSTDGLLVCFADGRSDVLVNTAGEYNNVIGYSIADVDVTNPLNSRVVLDSAVGGLYLRNGQDLEGTGILLGDLTLVIAPKTSEE